MTYTVKWVIWDPYSESDSSEIEEVFDLTVSDECASNEIEQTGTLEDVLHYLSSSGTTTTSITLSATVSGCSLTYALYFWDAPNYVWEEYTSSTASTYPFVQSFSDSDGTLVISSSDYATYENFSVRTKIVVTDERSSSTLNTFDDEFDLYLRDECRDVTISSGIAGFTGTAGAPYEWHMWQAQSVTFTGVSLSVSGCPTHYYITEDNAERTEETAVYTITDQGGNSYVLAGRWTDGEVSTRFYYLQAKVYNYLDTEQVAIDEVEYWLEVTNPCLRTDSITEQTIADLDYWIKDSAVSVTFTDFEDWASTAYSDAGTDLCGEKSYTIYHSDQFTPYAATNYPTVTDYLSYSVSGSTHTLSVETDDVSLYTNAYVTFYVRVILVDYYAVYPQYAIWYEPFRFRLKNCQVASYSWASVADVSYNVYTPVYWIDVPEFTQVPDDTTFSRSASERCGYTLTYTASWLNFYDTVIDLPPFITWNESDRRFEVYSADPDDIDTTRQFYVIQLTASVSLTDMDPIFEDTLQFNLYLANGCLADEITIQTDIDDYIYYINEDTYEPDFIQGTDIPQDK